MTNRRHDLSGITEFGHGFDGGVVQAQDIGVDLSARQHQRVVIPDIDIAQREVGIGHFAPVLFIPAPDGLPVRGGDMNGRALCP